jgi:hypothetical protein
MPVLLVSRGCYKLPLALNKEEVEKILNSVHNIKHKAISGINKISESSKKKGDV